MRTAIVIGCYAMPDFAELCAAQCRKLWPDSIILLSDDLSDKSPLIEAAAERHDCWYSVSRQRRSHCSGDWQAFINGAELAEREGCEIVIKFSQRCIPVAPDFAKLVQWYFEPHFGRDCAAIMPSKLRENQIARPGAAFYTKLGHLSDVVAFRVKTITPQVLRDHYHEGLDGTGFDMFSEVTWGRIMKAIPGVEIHDWLANMEPMNPKILLRKASSNSGEYARLAAEHGITGDFNVNEWKVVEGKDYRCIPIVPTKPLPPQIIT
jgi:hypothetical protein